MSTYGLGQPSECKRRLEASLPRDGGFSASVRVTPRDRHERQCPAYDADHYEVQAFHARASTDLLDLLEEALKAVPGVYATTQVRRTSDSVLAGNTFTNPAWPAPLGAARRGRHDLRPQVLALIRDEPTGSRDGG